MYKFHLINTKKCPAKLGVIRYYVFGGNTILLGQDFSFYHVFETKLFGHKKILGAQKIGEHCPPMPPLATSLPVKQNFRTWMKNCCIMFLVKLK